MIEPGKLLQNRYRIQKQIGQGGMGAVYVATDERFGSTVAIKETFFSDQNYGKAFEREARLLNNLKHSALPKVSDHFSDDDGQFLVMEYIEGEDLSEKMAREGKIFECSEVLNWADQLLDALDFLHTQSSPVVHRDIKPQNLKLTPRGQIILLDFGLAKGNPTGAQHQTQAKSVFGYSRNYASIEQIQGTGTEPRSDLYSLGATLYHLLTGVPPVDALTRAMQVLNGDPDPLKSIDSINPAVPSAVAAVLSRAMDLNSNQRPASALVMRAMLNDAKTGIAVSTVEMALPTNILTQQTEVATGENVSQPTNFGGVATEVMPAAMLPNGVTQGAMDQNEETSVKTRIEQNRQNIQIPVQPAIATEIRPLAQSAGQPKSKKGIAAAAVGFGLLLLAGTALAGLALLRPDLFSSEPSKNSLDSQARPASNPPVELSGGGNSDSGNVSSNVSSNGSEAVNRESSPVKQNEKPISAPPKTETAAKEPAKPAESKTEPDGKPIIDDGAGTKVFENGKIVTKEGVVIRPDGTVLAPPRPKPDGASPPDARMPPLTPEQMKNLTPAQRRRLRQIMENQRRPMPPKTH